MVAEDRKLWLMDRERFWHDEIVMELGSGDGCMTFGIY